MLRFRNKFTVVAVTVAKTQHSLSRYHGEWKTNFCREIVLGFEWFDNKRIEFHRALLVVTINGSKTFRELHNTQRDLTQSSPFTQFHTFLNPCLSPEQQTLWTASQMCFRLDILMPIVALKSNDVLLHHIKLGLVVLQYCDIKWQLPLDESLASRTSAVISALFVVIVYLSAVVKCPDATPKEMYFWENLKFHHYVQVRQEVRKWTFIIRWPTQSVTHRPIHIMLLLWQICGLILI